MNWILLSLSSGFLATLQGVYSKKGLLSDRYNDWTVMLARFLYVVPFFFVVWILRGMPHTVSDAPRFLIIIASLVGLEVVSQWHYHQAIKRAPLSLLTPIQSLTPLLIIPTTLAIRGEMPSLSGLAAILLIVAGLAVAKFEKPEEKRTTDAYRDPVRGARHMVNASILWALAATLQKSGTEHTDIAFFGLCYIGTTALVMLARHIGKRIPLAEIIRPQEAKHLVPIGFFAGFSYAAQYWALTMTHPAYVNAMKRAALGSNVFLDRKFFGEKIGIQRVASNILTIIGVILLAFSS